MLYKKKHGLKWLLSSFIHLTLLYKIYEVIRSVCTWITDLSYISDTLYSEELKSVLKRYLHTEMQRDWIGRLYGVINPMIDINGNLDVSGTIVEIDGAKTNSIESVKAFIYKQMDLIDNLFKINKLYDYIGVDVKHVGPLNADNYLVVIDVVSRKEMAYWLKRMLKQLLFYILLFSSLYYIVF